MIELVHLLTTENKEDVVSSFGVRFYLASPCVSSTKQHFGLFVFLLGHKRKGGGAGRQRSPFLVLLLRG